MKSFIVALGSAVCIAGASHAQSNALLCHHAGLTYSPGSMVAMGKSLQKCLVTDDGSGIWSPVLEASEEVESANCISAGREFGQGALISIGTFNLKCSKGIWYTQ